ncbi:MULTISPECIES: 16S rRNA (cytosine(1402)-N(4))-methyltransferase RsmH [Brevibacterium]|uniref:Ribosomal RNA small subunit methyltransferase H n=1 Tax=Brevibacterium salitolerans TaxID=1403566 RepID=A0ABN2X930_9MICO|nr:16S rRNA (cytosine(1402)-N(4))-methyltransferase RsmH [Brevibacterium sp.]
MEQFAHTPVLLERCVELVGVGVEAARAAGSVPVVVDGTLGMGGHTEGILAAFPDARVIGLDRDQEALSRARARLEPFGERFTGVHAVDDELEEVLAHLGLSEISSILLDLGVSSLQLDEDERGFSYSRPAPLDMRMDQSAGLTAAEVLNTYPEAEIARILREYGEEREARRIARAVVADREERPWETSDQLAGLLERVVGDGPGGRRKGGAAQRKRSHPAKRTFQALRIEVNRELDSLSTALPAALSALHVGGTAVVESYQSLEDVIVKRVFAAGLTDQAPPELPVVPEEMRAWLAPLTRGAEKADAAEIERNPRSASVRLRAVQKIGSTPAPARAAGGRGRR